MMPVYANYPMTFTFKFSLSKLFVLYMQEIELEIRSKVGDKFLL